MAPLSLSAVSVGVYTALNVAGLTALVSSRIYDDLPRGVVYPCVSYVVGKDNGRGLGTTKMDEIDLRVSAFSKSEDGAEGQAIAAKVEELLQDQSLTIAGHQVAGVVFFDRTVRLGDQEVFGEKVKEWVSMFRVHVEAA